MMNAVYRSTKEHHQVNQRQNKNHPFLLGYCCQTKRWSGLLCPVCNRLETWRKNELGRVGPPGGLVAVSYSGQAKSGKSEVCFATSCQNRQKALYLHLDQARYEALEQLFYQPFRRAHGECLFEKTALCREFISFQVITKSLSLIR